jgi:stage V sporulation protein G
MKITDVKVFPVDEDKLKAYATITFDNCFIVRDLKVISGNKGYFIAMPSKKRKDGTFRDVAHPLNSETRKMIEDAVLQVYEKEHATEPPSGTSAEEGAADTGRGAADIQAVHEGDVSEGDAPADEGSSPDTGDEAADIEEEPQSGEPGPAQPESPEEKDKGAEENPVIEPSDDPEKAFGYEE